MIRFDAAFHRGGTALEAGDADAANDMVEVAARVADRLRQPRFLWQARLMQTAQAVFRGALDDAEFFADEALELGRRAGQGSDAFVFHTEQLARDPPLAGSVSTSTSSSCGRSPASRTGTSATRSPATCTRPATSMTRCEIYRNAVGRGVPAVAPRHARRAIAVQPCVPRRARSTTHDRRWVCTTRCSRSPTPSRTRRSPSPSAGTTSACSRRRWERSTTAESCLRKAIAVHDMVGAPLFRAESEIELARILFDDGRDAERVTELLQRARADGCGAWIATSRQGVRPPSVSHPISVLLEDDEQ